MQNLDQATLQQILAMRNAQMRAGGNDSAEWWYDPNKTYDPATDTHGYMLENTYGFNDVGTGDSSTRVRDNSQDRAVIRRLRAGTGGKLGDMWDDKGNYIGEYQAQDGGGKQLNTAIALMAGGYAGGNYLAGLQGAGGAATGGMASAAAPTTTALGADALAVSLPSAAEISAGLTVPATTGTTGALTTGALATTAAQQLVDAAKSATQGTGVNLTPQNWIDLAKVGTAVLGTVATAGDDSTDDAQTRANSISDAQLQGMQFALDQSKELADYNRTTFRPVEQRLVQGAMDYATPGRMESAAQEATGRVASEFDATRQQAGREMIRYGMDPTTIAALGASSQLDEAKARAGAANQARDSVEQQGWSRMADVANLGRNIASSQATQQQIGLRAGDSAASNAATSARLGQAEDAQLIQGIGQIGNYVGELFAKSDKTKKKGTGKMADAAGALEQIEKTPVHDGWAYKDDPTGQKRTGPMAQDVKRVSGDKAAPGGKVIDLVSQQGRMMAAVQELARRVKKLEAA